MSLSLDLIDTNQNGTNAGAKYERDKQKEQSICNISSFGALLQHKQKRKNNRNNFGVTKTKSDACYAFSAASTEANLDFLAPCNEFLLLEETQGLHEDQVLFSVEQGELQPITSPFMVPGIYKKISTIPTKSTAALPAASNVFLLEQEKNGNIVSSSKFHDLYQYLNDSGDKLAAEYPKVQARETNKVHSSDNNNVQEDTITSNIDDSAEWGALEKLAYDIFKLANQDHIVIDRKRNEIVRTEYGTNQKTIYRFLTPETLALRPCSAQVKCNKKTEPIKLKLGRPRKRCVGSNETQPQAKIKSRDFTLPPKNVETQEKSEIRTRSGRLVKVVKPSLMPARQLEEETRDKQSADSAELMRNLLAELRDSDYRCNKAITPLPPSVQTSPIKEVNYQSSQANYSPTKRRIPPEAICPTCNKIFLGRRMQRHFIQHPDHMSLNEMPNALPANSPPLPPNTTLELSNNVNDDMTLFRFLIAKLQKSAHLNEDQRAELFLNEINDLVEQLQLRSSRLIRNTSGMHFVSARSARVLGIPEGQYALDMSAIEAPLEPEHFEHIHAHTMPNSSTVHVRNLDYTAISVSLDDTLTDEAAQKLNLSAGGKLLPPSEESLLRAVDDLVPNGMDKLSSTNLHLHPPVHSRSVGGTAVASMVPHYDHVSDNAVEAVTMKETNTTQQTTPILDLSVDFFQFNNN